MVLALHGLWRLVSEPLFTPPDQNFALGHASVIHADPTPQGNRYWVAFRVFWVTGFQVIPADCDRNCLALSGIYEGRPSSSILGITHTYKQAHCAACHGNYVKS